MENLPLCNFSDLHPAPGDASARMSGCPTLGGCPGVASSAASTTPAASASAFSAVASSSAAAGAPLLRCCAVFGHQYHRTTVLSNGFSWQGMRPTREGLPLLQLGQASGRRQGRSRREGRAGGVQGWGWRVLFGIFIVWRRCAQTHQQLVSPLGWGDCRPRRCGECASM